MVGVGDGVLLVGGGVATSVEVRSPVGSTVLVLLVVLSPKRYEMYTYGAAHFAEVCYIPLIVVQWGCSLPVASVTVLVEVVDGA